MFLTGVHVRITWELFQMPYSRVNQAHRLGSGLWGRGSLDGGLPLRPLM